MKKDFETSQHKTCGRGKHAEKHKKFGINTFSSIQREPRYPAYQKDQMFSEICAKKQNKKQVTFYVMPGFFTRRLELFGIDSLHVLQITF